MSREYEREVPEAFARWWMNGGFQDTEEATGRAWSTYDYEHETFKPIKSLVAYNCEVVREEYRRYLNR